VRIEEPVVVKPDTLSNHALVKVNSPPHRIYGSAPNKQERSQLNITMINPSLFVIYVVEGMNIKKNIPKRAVTNEL